MGNKTSPRVFRTGIYLPHEGSWFANKGCYPDLLLKDHNIRTYLNKKYYSLAMISSVNISMVQKNFVVGVRCKFPGVLVGKSGKEIKVICEDLAKIVGSEVSVKVFDIKKPDVDAALIAQNIAIELKKRGSSGKRIMKRYGQNAMKSGALGIRIECKGRINGAEIARTEVFCLGAVPRQKLRANIDYRAATSFSSSGATGVKVMVYKGDIIERKGI